MQFKKQIVMSQKAIARSRQLIEYTRERVDHFKKMRETKRPRRLDPAA